VWLNQGDRIATVVPFSSFWALISTKRNVLYFNVYLSGEAGLRLFQRSDARGLADSPRLGGHTSVGNHSGSLQDNPAPRLRQTGNVHL
jgi:hypothetical protein